MVFKKLAKTFRKSVTKKEKKREKTDSNGVTISSSPVPEAVEFTKETSSRPNKKQSSQGTTKTQPIAEDGNAEDDFFMGDIDEDDEHSEGLDESTEDQIEKLKHKIEQLELQKSSSKPDERSTSDDDLVALAALSFSGGGGLTKTTKSSKHMSSIDLSSLAKQEEALQPRRARLPRRSSMKKLTELENDSSDQPARFDKPQRRLSVGFSSCPIENSVEYTLHHKDMTNEEKMNVWMQTDCTTKIQQHCLQVVKTAETFGDDAVCTRGLEQYLSKNAHHREGQVEGVEEVLVEQEIQKQFGMSCADSIASAYKTVGKSDESQTRAHLRAMADQEEAKAYLKTMQEDVLDTVHTRDEAKQYLLSLAN